MARASRAIPDRLSAHFSYDWRIERTSLASKEFFRNARKMRLMLPRIEISRHLFRGLDRTKDIVLRPINRLSTTILTPKFLMLRSCKTRTPSHRKNTNQGKKKVI